MKYLKVPLLSLLLLSLASCAEKKANLPKQETAKELLVKYLANNLKNARIKNAKMTNEEQKDFVIASIDEVDKSPRGTQILSAMKKEHIEAIQVTKKMNSCFSKANQKKDAQSCLKEMEQSVTTLGKSYPSIKSDNLVWTKQKKQYMLSTTTKTINSSEYALHCMSENTTVTSAFKCYPQKTKYTRYTAYDYLLNQVIVLANTNLMLEIGDKIFNESCKLSKVTIFEQPVVGKGVYFDKTYYPYGSYHDVNEQGEYKSINHHNGDDKSRIDIEDLLEDIGFFERNTKKSNTKYLYYDEKNLKGISTKEIKSRYKVVTEKIEDKSKSNYGVNGFSINIIDNKNNKVIASTIFYDNFQKKKLCAKTYDGNLDQEYFVYNVFSK